MQRVVTKLAVLLVFGTAVVAMGTARAEASELDLTGSGTCTGSACAGSFTDGSGNTYWDFAGALWATTEIQPTGSGYIDSFVRIQDASGGTRDVVDGHNTSGTRVNDEKPGPTFTHDVLTNDLALVTINGEQYYQFLLDINQTGADPILSLSGLQLCTAGSGGLSMYDTCANGTMNGASKMRYDLDGVVNYPDPQPETENPVNNVLLDYSKNSGSGSGDLFVYIPKDILPVDSNKNKYLYLWSQFGLPAPNGNNDGYEEWAFLHKGSGSDEPFNQPSMPEPGSLILLGTGLLLAGNKLRKRRAATSKA